MTNRFVQAAELFREYLQLTEERTDVQRKLASVEERLAEITQNLGPYLADGVVPSSSVGEPGEVRPGRRTRKNRMKDGREDKVVELLREHPGADHHRIAACLYGESGDEEMHKVRAYMNYLKNKGVVRRVGLNTERARWEVAT